MAKVNVNKATREELVDVAGLRPQVADAILKLREEQGGRIAGLEELRDLRGVGEATLEQLRDLLTFGAKAAREVAEAAVEAAAPAAERTAEVTALVTRSGTEAAQKAMDSLAGAESVTAEHSGQAATDLSQLVVELINEQIEANLETLQALARARTWQEAVEAQNAYLRGSLERLSEGTSLYLETMTRLMAGMAEAGRDEVKKAA